MKNIKYLVWITLLFILFSCPQNVTKLSRASGGDDLPSGFRNRVSAFATNDEEQKYLNIREDKKNKNIINNQENLRYKMVTIK